MYISTQDSGIIRITYISRSYILYNSFHVTGELQKNVPVAGRPCEAVFTFFSINYLTISP
jgi:hypothetical protein